VVVVVIYPYPEKKIIPSLQINNNSSSSSSINYMMITMQIIITIFREIMQIL
jgi:hypothetical protein